MLSLLVGLTVASLGDSVLNFDPHAALNSKDSTTKPTAPTPAPTTSGSTTTPATGSSTIKSSGNSTTIDNQPKSNTENESKENSQQSGSSTTWVVTGVSCGAAAILFTGGYVLAKRRRKRKDDLESVFTGSSKSTSYISGSTVRSPASDYSDHHVIHNKGSESSLGSSHPISPMSHFKIKNVESYELPEKKLAINTYQNTMFSTTTSSAPKFQLSSDLKKQTSMTSITSSNMSDTEEQYKTRNVENIAKSRIDSMCSTNKAFSHGPISPNLI